MRLSSPAGTALLPAVIAAAVLLALSGALLRGDRVGAGGGAIMDLPGCTDNVLPLTDDGSTGQLALPFSPNFFGTTFSNLYVNNNGSVTFDNPMFQSQTTALADLDRPVIAPFFADVDTQGLGSDTVKYGATTVDGHDAFCVRWVDVGYYNDHADKLNRAQLLLIDRSDIAAGDFDIMFNYDKIEWETGDAQGGIGGLGGQSARAGYSDGTSSYEIDGSGIAGCFLDTATTSGLIHNRIDSNQDGRYVFQARSGSLPTSPLPTACLEPAPTDTPTPTATDTHTPTPTATRTPTPIASAGDVNCDGDANSLDALLVLQRVAGFFDAFDCEVGDVDGSGGVDAVDATLILQYDAGLIPGLPV